MRATKPLFAESWADVIIVGGGASGALLACHLLRDPACKLRVALIEKGSEVGRGIGNAGGRICYKAPLPAL